MTPLRLLFITDRYPPQPGGAAVSAGRMTGLLADCGHEIHVLHLNPQAEPGTVYSRASDGFVVHELGELPDSAMTLQLAERVLTALHERLGFDLLHGHGIVPAGYLAAFCGRRLGRPSFISARGNDVERGMFSGSLQPLVVSALTWADAVGCVTRDLVSRCQALSSRRDVHYTPNSVDANVFTPAPRDAELLAALDWQDEPVLGFVGELRLKKGPLFVLEGFRVVRATRPARLLLVGGMRGEDRAMLRRYLREYPDLRSDIHVVDYVQDRPELARYYSLMDLVLLPALWDGMPNSALEAMACGRVLLASDAGGLREVVTPGETGFLLGFEDLRRLGEGCLELLDAGPDFLAEVGGRAREFVLARHQPVQELERLLGIYASLLGNRLE